jgi:hypothetical protein
MNGTRHLLHHVAARTQQHPSLTALSVQERKEQLPAFLADRAVGRTDHFLTFTSRRRTRTSRYFFTSLGICGPTFDHFPHLARTTACPLEDDTTSNLGSNWTLGGLVVPGGTKKQ